MVTDLVPTVKTPDGDCLECPQLQPWFEAVRALPNPVISAYLQTMLITGARRNEIAKLHWMDIDFKQSRMVTRDKVEKTRTIPLPPCLAALLDASPP